ncbi:MAG TPA: type II toxin-antitoxin system RelE/ParE family toxin [Pyrinomonadaceae bacterium]|nr:type II toxin-antitoxin system RelE/ParE family toxin [Pyrinomonadaceae bacterium]
MNIRFLTVADQEVDDAVGWYAQRDNDVSRGFLDDLDRAVRLARTYPLLATQIEPEIRRLLFLRYPYSLIYGIDEDTLVIIAVAHQQREPRYWADRLDSPQPTG